MTMKKNWFLIFFLCLFAFACATSPRGRKVLKLMPDDQLNAMGLQAFDDMKKQTPVEHSAAINNYVKCVLTPLTEHATEVAPQGGWEIVVFKNEEPNAFALPGGKIGVQTGIFKAAQTPGQLAAVVGHEIGHVWAGHSNERVSENIVAQGGLALAGAAMSERNRNWQVVLASLGLQAGVLLPHSRDQESEADILGLDLMSRAGFDPNEALTLWENMKQAAGGGPPEFMSTHPAPDTRMQNIRNHIPEFMAQYKAAAASAPHCVKSF
jgi:predicted Zn-dependent protease